MNDINSHFHFIDYISEKIFVTDNGDKNKVIILEQNSIIPDYINIILFKIQNYSNIDILPAFYGTNTIMSVNLCYAFLYKQMILLNITEEKNIKFFFKNSIYISNDENFEITNKKIKHNKIL